MHCDDRDNHETKLSSQQPQTSNPGAALDHPGPSGNLAQPPASIQQPQTSNPGNPGAALEHPGSSEKLAQPPAIISARHHTTPSQQLQTSNPGNPSAALEHPGRLTGRLADFSQPQNAPRTSRTLDSSSQPEESRKPYKRARLGGLETVSDDDRSIQELSSELVNLKEEQQVWMRERSLANARIKALVRFGAEQDDAIYRLSHLVTSLKNTGSPASVQAEIVTLLSNVETSRDDLEHSTGLGALVSDHPPHGGRSVFVPTVALSQWLFHFHSGVSTSVPVPLFKILGYLGEENNQVSVPIIRRFRPNAAAASPVSAGLTIVFLVSYLHLLPASTPAGDQPLFGGGWCYGLAYGLVRLGLEGASQA